MTERKRTINNIFCWIELATNDHAGAKKFYSSIFPWEFKDSPMGQDQIFSMIKIKGKDIGALYSLSQKQKVQRIAPYWLSYICVSDVDGVVKRAQELGGKILVDPHDVSDAGRTGVLLDPQGAVFALWQARKHKGSQIVNEPGTFSWNELVTSDSEGAREFYSRLLGWTTVDQEIGGSLYTSFLKNEQPVAGMIQMDESWGGMVPHWMVYFAVENCEETVRKITSAGGSVLKPPTTIPDVGQYAVVQDPQGAVYSIIQLKI